MANQKISQLAEAVAVADTDQFAVVRGAGNNRMKMSTLRALNGLRGSWDVSGALASAVPVSASGVTFAATINPEEFNATFTSSASPIKVAVSSSGALPVAQAWAKYVVPAADGGDNDNGAGLFIANGSATDADIIASIAGFPTLVGSVNFVALCIHTGGNRGFYVVGPLGMEGAVITGGVVAGDVLYFGVDAVADAFIAQINAGSIASINHAFAGSTVKVGVIGSFAADPPILLDSPVLFSLGTTDAGKTAFAAVADATPPIYPVGTLNGTRWLVQNSGTFNGKALADGDVAEFFNNATGVIVTPSTSVTPASAAGIADAAIAAATPGIIVAVQDVVGAYVLFAEGRIVDIINTSVGATPGNLYLIGTSPTVDLSGFAPGSMAVLTADGWVNFTKARCLGRMFSLGSLLYGGWFLIMESDVGLSATTTDPYFHRYWNTVAIGSEAETEISLRALGWVLHPAPRNARMRIREYAFAGVPSGSIDQTTADYHDVNVADGDSGNFTLFMGVAGVPVTNCIVSVWNVGVGPITMFIGADSYAMAAGQRRFFMAFGDSLLGIQAQALLSP